MKKSLRWLIIAVMAVSMVLTVGFIGCKTETAETTAAETTAAETTAAETTAAETTAAETTAADLAGTSINMMCWKWSTSDENERMTNKFTEDTGIEVNLETLDYANYYQTFTTKLNGSDLDIAFLHAAPFYYPYADANSIYTMEELGVDISSMLPGTLAGVQRNGKTWLFSGGLNAMLMYVNNTILADNGWEQPTDWESLMTLCQAMVDKGIKPFDCAFEFNNTRYIWFPLEAIRISHAQPDFWDKAISGEIAKPFEEQVWKDIMADIVYMWENNYLDNTLSPAGTEPIMYDEFGTGKTALLFGGTWSISSLRTYADEQGLDYTGVRTPGNNADFPEIVLPVAPAPGYGINRNTTKLEQCKAFANWWAEQCSSGWVSANWGWVPGTKDTPFSLWEETGQTQLNDFYAGPTELFTETKFPSIEIVDFIDKQLQDVFTGSTDLDTAIVNMQGKWDEVMAK